MDKDDFALFMIWLGLMFFWYFLKYNKFKDRIYTDPLFMTHVRKDAQGNRLCCPEIPQRLCCRCKWEHESCRCPY